MKKKKEDGNSSFLQHPQQARGNTPDARNFSFVHEMTPMYNSSEFEGGMKATSTLVMERHQITVPQNTLNLSIAE